MSQAGKGDTPRPVNRKAWEEGWARIEAAKREREAAKDDDLDEPLGPACQLDDPECEACQ